MLLLCPQCLIPGELTAAVSSTGERSWTCGNTRCGKANLPYRYAEEYDRYPPVPVCIVGNTGHGKTAFLAGTFRQLDAVTDRGLWPGFTTEALDDNQYRMMREKLAEYEAGDSPAISQEEKPEPLVVRCHGIPRVGGCQLVFLDNSGEAYQNNAGRMMLHSSYVANAPAVVWLASLTDPKHGEGLTPPRDFRQTLTNYQTAMANMGGSTRRQTVVLTLTKGERLTGLPAFPQSAKGILGSELTDRAADPWAALQKVHDDLHHWLRTETNYAGFLAGLEQAFRRVYVCVVSAQGREFDPDARRAFEPKAVLSPLFWLWRSERPGVWVDAGGKSEYFLSLADALHAAPAGAVVRIQEGEHHLAEPVPIRRPLTVRGEGSRAAVVVRGRGGDCVFDVQTPGTVEFANMMIERAVRDDIPAGDVVRVMRGTFRAEKVTFRAEKAKSRAAKDASGPKKPVGNGLSVGKDAVAAVTDCLFANNQAAGVWGFGTAKLTIDGSFSKGNKYGLLVTAGAAAAATGSTFELSRCHGAFVQDGGRLTLADCRLVNNDIDGLKAIATAQVEMAGGACTGNAECGVEVRESAEVKIQGGDFDQNRDGIVLADDSAGDIRRVGARENKGCGVRAEGASRGQVADCKLNGNAGIGLHLAGTSRVGAAACETLGNTKGGVVVEATVDPKVVVKGCGRVDDRRKGWRPW